MVDVNFVLSYMYFFFLRFNVLICRVNIVGYNFIRIDVIVFILCFYVYKVFMY